MTPDDRYNEQARWQARNRSQDADPRDMMTLLVDALNLPEQFAYWEADVAFWQALDRLDITPTVRDEALHTWLYISDHDKPSVLPEPTPAEMAAFAECARRIIANQ